MKRISLFLWASILFCSMLAAQDKEETAGRKFAVLVGVNDYTGAGGVDDLQYAKRDMEALRDQLIKIGFEKENVFCLIGGGKFKNEPTRQNILKTINHVRGLAKEGDIFILAMSGHGILAGGKSCFCPIDTDSADYEKTTIPTDIIFDLLKMSKATFKLMIVDACRNKPSSGAKGDVPAFPTLSDPPAGCLLLQSCSEEEKSFEDDELKHSIFSHYLIEGLSGKAAKDGKITLEDIVSYAGENTTRRAFDTRNVYQTPRLSGEITNFIIWEGKPGPKAGNRKVLTIGGVKYAFRWCPAGKFMMGSPEEESQTYGEKRHEVTLTRGFWMLETQVTQEMWESVTGENPSSIKDSVKQPVETVSWNDCQKYIKKLNKLKGIPAGYKFSLPTEAQWEYACRAGPVTAFNNGIDFTGTYEDEPNLDDVAWFMSLHEVGLKKPNLWGLFDMHGNISEWCLDWYGDYPEGSVTDPTGPATGENRVRRGAHCCSLCCRSAGRNIDPPAGRYHYVGFRVALVRD